ncbi:DUF6765 family protein [Acanthopleuribacter pedis]|uniref:Uncharacterized protein n=1 Tax=Acanthopleuribacter pedis TaxID=442870 RepID=A0A8J7Q6Q7_9BACT|nr:DUF6765 family protein [Acanthopleuribacter pedis]MBO1317764.1 hypothetical protein [Acanthopleuribacter pedis]
MDQDFHYYGTYYAARMGKFNREDATRIAKASNFIDFLSNELYAGYWHMVRDTAKPAGDWDVVTKVDYPRYTFQGTLSTGAGGSGGLWASYHFVPGNYAAPAGTPSAEDVHGAEIAGQLPGHQLREVDLNPNMGIDAGIAPLLNRPQSPLSRLMIKDTITLLNDPSRLEAIINLAAGGKQLLAEQNKDDILKRFGLLLLGARAHVIADTWAHQDWGAANNVANTYWDVNSAEWGNQFWQTIDYRDVGDWTNVHLSVKNQRDNENLAAVPNLVSYVGHGWLGHLPDFSFIKYRYKPCWRAKDQEPLVRENPLEYKFAFLELCSLFAQCAGGRFQPDAEQAKLAAAQTAMETPCDIAVAANSPRVFSAKLWQAEMKKIGFEAPIDLIDTFVEPDPKAVLEGQIGYDTMMGTRYGSYYVNYASDLYLFQIAADYHFRFTKHWLAQHKVGTDLFSDSWSLALGPLPQDLSSIL